MSRLATIVVPVYNVEAYLSRCVDSLLAQTYPRSEIILVDDGSPDKCPKLCDEYAERYDNIRVVHKENGGLASARLAGFREARGDYILFVDSDDYIHPAMLEKLIHALEERDADLSICGYYQENADGLCAHMLSYQTDCLDGRGKIESDYILPLLGKSAEGVNLPGFLCIRLLKKSLIQEAFFGSERVYYMEDHVFDLLYADRVQRIAVVNEPLYYYCYNGESLSNRYRANKWGMYGNLYGFYLDYVKDRALPDCARRLNNFLVGAFCACVDNAVLSGSFGAYRRELAEILRSERMREVWRAAENAELSNSARLNLLLCRVHAYGLLYLIRRSRLNRNASS